MDGYRDRFNGRDRKMPERGMSDRGMSDRGMRDRYDRPDRYERGRSSAPSYGQESYGPDVEAVIEQSNAKQLEVLADCIDDVKDEVYASEQNILKAINSMPTGTPAVVSAPAQIDPMMKEEVLAAIAGNKQLLEALYVMLQKPEVAEAPAASVEEAEAPVEEAPAKEEFDVKAFLTKMYADMEDHVHKENVKCYRNVQAAINEQAVQASVASKSNLTSIKIFSIITMVLTAMNIVLWVCEKILFLF